MEREFGKKYTWNKKRQTGENDVIIEDSIKEKKQGNLHLMKNPEQKTENPKVSTSTHFLKKKNNILYSIQNAEAKM